MDIIGRGAQYKVIDTHDGRVRKIPLTYEESQAVVTGWYVEGEAAAEELAVDYCGPALEAYYQIESLLGVHPALAASFGNPVFEGAGTYTQDKVQVLGEVLNTAGVERGKKLIDDYVELIVSHWHYGVSEQVFNFTVNNGLNAAGQLVLIDFGEITTSYEAAAAQVASRRWLKSHSYNRRLPAGVKGYYRGTMKKQLTLDRLEAVWGHIKL